MKVRKSEVTKKAAVEMVRSGTSINKTAKTYGVSFGTVSNWLKKYPRTAKPKALREASQKTHITIPPTRDYAKIRDAITTLESAGLI